MRVHRAIGQSMRSVESQEAHTRTGSGRWHIGMVAILAATMGGLAACDRAPVEVAKVGTEVTVTRIDARGIRSTSTVAALVVEQDGLAYVDAPMPTSGQMVRFQIEEPALPFTTTAGRTVGSKVRTDSLNISTRIKALSNGYPSEFAMLNATTLDTIAVYRSNPAFSSGIVHTNYFHVRLPDGQSVSMSVLRPYASRVKVPKSSETFGSALASLAAECATRTFNLLAPPMAVAQATTPLCTAEKRALATAAKTQAGTFALAGPAATASLWAIGSGVAASAIVPGSGALSIFGGVVGLGSTVFGMVTTTWSYNDAVSNLADCQGGAGGTKRFTRAPAPVK
jgi:hypothetical protein